MTENNKIELKIYIAQMILSYLAKKYGNVCKKLSRKSKTKN